MIVEIVAIIMVVTDFFIKWYDRFTLVLPDWKDLALRWICIEEGLLPTWLLRLVNRPGVARAVL